MNPLSSRRCIITRNQHGDNRAIALRRFKPDRRLFKDAHRTAKTRELVLQHRLGICPGQGFDLDGLLTYRRVDDRLGVFGHKAGNTIKVDRDFVWMNMQKHGFREYEPRPGGAGPRKCLIRYQMQIGSFLQNKILADQFLAIA